MQLIRTFDKSKKGLLLIDYDGTLVEFEAKPDKAIPTERVLVLLKKLNQRANTKVVIISGRGHLDMERFLGHLPISIIAEHGAMCKFNGEWKYINKPSDSWKRVIYPILNRFTLDSPHTFVEEKHFSLVWHYRNLPEEIGLSKSRELIQMLKNSVLSLGLKLLDGDKVIEIMYNNIGKGYATQRIIEENKFDYIISIGDDKTDEEVFSVLSHNNAAETIKVGNGPTLAKHRLENVSQVLLFLEHLVSTTEN